jgi:integrase/recombinase XerD
MSNAGIPLRVIQEISGHRTLTELQKYLEVTETQVRGAVSALSMISHGGKPRYNDLDLESPSVPLIQFSDNLKSPLVETD